MKHLNSILRRFRRTHLLKKIKSIDNNPSKSFQRTHQLKKITFQGTHQLKKIKSIDNNPSKSFQICIVVPPYSPISISKKKEQETLVIIFTLLFSGFL